MSTDLGTVRGRPGAGEEQGPGLQDSLSLTRFGGGDDGVCVQVTIGGRYAQLDADGVAEVVGKLQAALRPAERDLSHDYLARTAEERRLRDETHGVPWRVKVANALGRNACPMVPMPGEDR